MKIATFNILAPCWAHSKWFDNIEPAFLDPTFRTPKIKKIVNKISADIIIITESQPKIIENILTEYNIYSVSHHENYWSDEYIKDEEELLECPWTSDYKNHGISIGVKKTITSSIFSKIKLKSGNCSLILKIKEFFLLGLHLDPENCINEWDKILKYINKNLPDEKIVVGGDFNFDITENLCQNWHYFNFKQTSTYYNEDKIIDNIITRNINIKNGHIYQTKNAFCQIGSDHFPLYIKI
jgi:hypothetical protein